MTDSAAVVAVSIAGTLIASLGSGYLIYRLEQNRNRSDRMRGRLEHVIVALERMKLHPGTRLSEERYYDFLVATAYLDQPSRERCVSIYGEVISHPFDPGLTSRISQLQDDLRRDLL